MVTLTGKVTVPARRTQSKHWKIGRIGYMKYQRGNVPGLQSKSAGLA